MRRHWLVASAVLALAAAPASAADRTLKLGPATQAIDWTGAKATGVFAAFYGFVGEPCTKAPVMYCDETLFEVDFPEKFGNVSLTVSGLGNGTDDFDAYLYRINPDGSVGEQVKYSNNEGPGREALGQQIATNGVVDSKRWLLKVPYYFVQDAAYTATVRAHGFPAPAADEQDEPTPPPPPDPDPPEDRPGDPPVDQQQDDAKTEKAPDPKPTPPPAPASTAASTAPAPAPAPAAPPAPPAAPASRLWVVRRRGAFATVRLRCAVTCSATVRAGRTRRSLVVAAGDTHEFVVRAPRGAAVRAVVRPRRGGSTLVLRAR